MRLMEMMMSNKTETVAALTNDEVHCHAVFSELLDDGYDCVTTVGMCAALYPSVTDEFLAWLQN